MPLIRLILGLLAVLAAVPWAAAAEEDAAAPKVTAWFGNDVPLRTRLREAIGEAEHDVAVAMDRFLDYSMADALITAARRGRRVRVIVDGDRKNVLVGKALGDHLAAGGVEVSYDRADANLYDRFVVIDDHAVIVGSYPFIDDASSSPMTDVVVIEDAAVAAQYLRFFDFIWNLTK